MHALPFTPSPRAWCTPSILLLPPSNTTSPTSSSYPIHPFTSTDTAVCVAAWPVASTPRLALAFHTQDHSGTLGADEFKACLISLGFDIANDAQVLNRCHTPAVRGLTGFFFSPFVLFPYCISILPSILPLFPPAYPSFSNVLCDLAYLATSTLWIVFLP